MNGIFGIDCGDKWLGRWPESAIREPCTQAVGLGYANRWPFGPEKHLNCCSRKLWGIKRLPACLA